MNLEHESADIANLNDDKSSSVADDPWDWSNADAGPCFGMPDSANARPVDSKAIVLATHPTLTKEVTPVSQNPTAAPAATQTTLADTDDLDAAWAANDWPPFPYREKSDFFPGFMARSALFKAGRASETLSAMTVIPAQSSTISISGPRLNMKDKHVWETAVQVAKESPNGVGSPLEISLRDFAKRMGMAYFKGPALTAIWESLERLASARVHFQFADGCSGIGSMLATAARRNKCFYIRINPDFAIPAFTGDRQFRMNSSRRSGLSCSLAQWLHDFYTTHSTALDMDLEYLRELSGYEGPKRNFPMRLRLAMKELAQSAPNLILSFTIHENGKDSAKWMLSVVRGTETAQYKQPAKVHSRPRPSARHGGVAL
jgi:hypothetical protein